MRSHPYVVFARKLKGFETLEQAKQFALANVPAVICERRRKSDGTSELVEIARHDFLYDESRGEWRVMLA